MFHTVQFGCVWAASVTLLCKDIFRVTASKEADSLSDRSLIDTALEAMPEICTDRRSELLIIATVPGSHGSRISPVRVVSCSPKLLECQEHCCTILKS